MNCPGSIVAEENLPDTAGAAAAEGTVAHALAEYTLRRGHSSCVSYLEELRNASHPETFDFAHDPDVAEQAADNGFADPVDYVQSLDEDVMAATLQPYIDFVGALHKPTIEERVHYGRFVKDGSGTADTFALSLDRTVLDVVDLKYGYGRVLADNNPQGKCYALGVLEDFAFLCEDVEVVRITIVQPRLNAVSTWETTPAELYEWAENELAPAALATEDEDAPRIPGPKQCHFCKALATCKAAADFAQAEAIAGFDSDDDIADTYTRDPKTLNPEQTGRALERLPFLKSWAAALAEHAENRVLGGETIPGFILGRGPGSSKWEDEEAVMKKLTRRLKIDGAAPRTMLSPAKAKEALKANGDDPDKVLKGLVTYTPGKPKLKPENGGATPVNLTEGFE